MLNGAAILLNGVGTLNGIYAIFLVRLPYCLHSILLITLTQISRSMQQKKHDGEDITMLEIAQLSSSLFIFTHSVYNFQTASKIVASAQKATIGEYRRGLSRNQQ